MPAVPLSAGRGSGAGPRRGRPRGGGDLLPGRRWPPPGGSGDDQLT